MTDAELLREIAGGDRDALETIVSRYEPAVFRFGQALTGDRAAAEDVLQETFLAVWKNAGTFRGAGSARSWVLSIVRNAANRRFRRHAGEPGQMESLSDLGAAAGFARVDPQIADRLADRELVEIGFRGLPVEDREILLLRDGEGYSGEEVAEALGISLAAMKSRLHRARLRFLAGIREKIHA
jgi:RNA polymerase sigma-70 factor (ECF subfamily)